MATNLKDEVLRMTEQHRLDSLKAQSERNRLGQFATPPELARQIAEYALQLWSASATPTKRAVFFDPAVGTGSFFSAFRQVFPRHRRSDAIGIELDPAFANSARELWARRGLQVTEADFTKSAVSQKVSLVLTNPPYVRHHHLNRDDKLRLQHQVSNQLGIRISGLAGLYCHFLLLADNWLADNALSFWLIPSEFMTVNYGTAVKEYLTKHVTLLHIHRFCPEDVQFSDALVSSAIVVFRKSSPPASHRALFSLGGTLAEPNRSQLIPLDELSSHVKWTKYPLQIQKRRRTTKETVLGDLFSIKRGLATGDNRFFILKRDEARSIGIPDQFLKPILPSPRYLPETIVEAHRDGYPRLSPQLALVDCQLPEATLKRDFPAFHRYLQSGLDRRVHEGYLTSRRIPWYYQEQREPPPFVCTYMGRTNSKGDGPPFRFIWNKSKATAANVYLLLYPKPNLLDRFTPSVQEQVFDLLSRITSDMFASESRVYGGGLYKLEPKELARVSAHHIAAALGGLHVQRQAEMFA